MELSTLEDIDSERQNPSWPTKATTPKDPKVDYCGIGPWRPVCLEPLRDIRAFIAAMCFVSCIQAAYSGYTSSQITTIEKRFAISSSVVGVVSSFFEVGYISCVMIVSYLGSKGRVPLWISFGLFFMSFGAFIFQTPQFLYPYGNSFSSGKNVQLCTVASNSNDTVLEQTCGTNDDGAYHFLPIFLLAQFLIGAGSSPILTLAPTFIDDHVPPSKAPGMIASIYAAAALGPVFGYALGAFTLQHPMDFWSTKKILGPDLTPTSPDWIGAWWSGYILLGCGVFLGACILVMFPRTLRSSFAHHRPSLETVKPSSEVTVSDPISDSNMHNAITKAPHALQEISTIAPLHTRPLIDNHLPFYARPAYQHHQRSFSGNVVFSAAPITAPHASVDGLRQPKLFGPRRSRHQRSASVGSVLLHAAIVAATASHAEVVVEDDDAVISTDTDISESCSESPDVSADEIRQRRKQSTPLRPPSYFPSPFNRSRSRGRKQGPQLAANDLGHQRWTPVPRMNGASTALDSVKAPRTRGHPSGLPPPVLDVMVEDNNSEAPSTPIKHQVTSDGGASASLDVNNNTKPLWKSVSSDEQGLLNSKVVIQSGESDPPGNVTVTPSSAPPTSPQPSLAPSTSRPSIFTQLHRHRKRRRRKFIRGRIFGFLADWSKDIPKSICGLLKNTIYTVTCLCIWNEMFVVMGFASFLPKYLEIEYQISKSKASMIAGIFVIPSGALGIFAGGLILNKARFNNKAAVIFVFCVNFIIMICMGSFFFLGCENPRIAGITVPYVVGKFGNGTTETSVITPPKDTPCCRSCGCNPKVWHPVCHQESSTIFFSPCFAGCTEGPSRLPNTNQSFAVPANWTHVSLRAQYKNANNQSNPTEPSLFFDDELIEGVCAPGCKTLIPFVGFLIVLLFLTGVIQNPLIIVTMRSVGRHERSLALGLQFVIVRLLANIPSPIAFAWVIDNACMHWKSGCGRTGDCAFTDPRKLTNYITGLALTVKCLGSVIYAVLIYLLSRRHPISSRSGSRTREEVNDTEPSTTLGASSFRDVNGDTVMTPLRDDNLPNSIHHSHTQTSAHLSSSTPS